MARYALLIDGEFCTGCHSCEVACQQEHDYPVGTNGVIVKEYEYMVGDRVRIDYMPYFTKHCDLCMGRLARDRDAVPTCVKHCQARCMEFGQTSDLAKTLADRPSAILVTHTPTR
jgi:Fe-S-cluster-containing dehydrogenase component